MKHNRWMMAFLVGGAMLLAAGCVKEKTTGDAGIPGTRIVFSALTSYENSDATRTEYSGVLYGTTDKIERIDWVANTDKFTVNYAAGTSFTTADYLVTSVNAEDYNSKAGVTEANKGEILAWAGGSDHKFYAMYPPHTVNSTASLTNVNHFQASLPAAQPQTHTKNVTVDSQTWSRWLPDMNNAYMVAYAGTDNGMVTGGGVTLPFRPAVTTFEFRLRRAENEEGKKIRYFKLISDGHALTGQFSFDITGGNARGGLWNESAVTVEAKTAENSVITVDFGATGVEVPEYNSTSYLDFTIFAVPKNLNDLKVQLVDIEGVVRELPLKDKDQYGNFTTYHSFTGAKKYVISNSTVPGDWIYVIEASDDIVTYGHKPVANLPYSVKSYKYKGSTVMPVPWKLQYTLDGTTWVDFGTTSPYLTGVIHGPDYSPDPSAPDWNLSFETNIIGGLGTGNFTDTNPGILDLLGTSSGKVTGDAVAAAQRAKLASHEPRGTSSTNAFDLSMHPVYGTIDDVNSNGMTTANSYVISAPGYYMFPCVYGNGITMGIKNVSAYAPADAAHAVNSYFDVSGDSRADDLKEVNDKHNTDASYWRAYATHFYNVDNSVITSPYIFDDLSITNPSAVVVWQDTDADNGDNKHQIIPFTSGYVGLTTKTMTIDGETKTVDYIWFKVDADRIKPGNFVIALRGTTAKVTSDILWSWHIWITPDDLTPNDVVTNSTGTYNLMPKNMGWFDSDNGTVSQWPNRDMQFRVIQTEAYGKDGSNQPLYKEDTFNVKQIGDADQTTPTVGGNVYYQWGRKDPFLPVGSNGKNHPVVYNSLYYPDRIQITEDGIKDKTLPGTMLGTDLDYGSSIREPYSPYHHFSNVPTGTIYGSPVGYIGGPVYPYQQPGDPVYEYYIQPGHEKYGPFNNVQATVLQNSDFCDFVDWIEYRPHFTNRPTYYRLDRDFRYGPYTEAEKDWMTVVARNLFEGSFEERADGWYLTSKINGPYTSDQGNYLNSEYNDGNPSHHVEGYSDANHWAIVAQGGTYVYELPMSHSYYYGPYSQAEASSFVQQRIFTAGFPGNNLDMEATQVGGGGGPYPASMRSQAANVTNLWNAYQYDEETSGSSYTNKFKTIYDPCPPGFTVPVKQVFVGSRTFSDNDRWTGQNGMHMKISSANDVFHGMNPSLVSGYGNSDTKGLLLSGGIFLPYTGARVFRNVGGEVLHAEGMGTAGYYWSDSPLRMDYRYPTTPGVPGYDANHANDGPNNISVMGVHYWFYFDAYGLIFGSDADYDHYINNSYRVQSYTRATAFSVRPMKDPKVTY